jgi:hypothetical protein
MITADARQVRQLENKLERLNARGVLYAELQTVNRAAFETQAVARRDLGGRMVLRDKWSERSIRVDRANRQNMAASVGSALPYMETQEIGGTTTPSAGQNVAIPTSVASGEGRDAKPRQRLVRRPNKIRNIRLGDRQRTGNRKQRNAVAVKEALRTGNRYVFLELQQRKGIFRVYGGRRRPRIEMIQDLSRRTTRVPRNPWLLPAANTVAQQLPSYYAAALRQQLARVL